MDGPDRRPNEEEASQSFYEDHYSWLVATTAHMSIQKQ